MAPNLRPFRQDDVELYHRWMKDPAVLGEHVEEERTPLADLLETFRETGWQGPCEWYYMYEGPQNKIMGYAHWWRCDKYESHIEFGRILVPPYRGTGIGTRFLQAILTEIFQTQHTDRIQAITSTQNSVVLQQWKKCGIQVEGTLRSFMRLRGNYVDCHIGSMLRSEWNEATWNQQPGLSAQQCQEQKKKVNQ